MKKQHPRCTQCVSQSPSPVSTHTAAFAPITPPMAGAQPRHMPAAPQWQQQQQQQQPFGGGFGTPTAAQYQQPLGAARSPLGFGQQGATVGFAVPQQQQQQQQQPFGYAPPAQQQQQHPFAAQRQLFGADAADGFASMDWADEPWLAQFSPRSGHQFTTFQQQQQQQQHPAHTAAAPPNPRAIAFLTAMTQKGLTVPIQKAMALTGNDVNKTAVLLNVAVKKLGQVQNMKRGAYRATVEAAIQAHGGCLVSAWAQVEQAYKLVVAVQRMPQGAQIASQAVTMAKNDLVQAATLLRQYAAAC